MPGKSIDRFNDFVMLTNQHVLEATTDSGILAEVQNLTYATGLLAKGKSASQVVKTGKKISTFSQFVAGTDAAFYQPGDSFSAEVVESNTQLDFLFRFMHGSYSYVKHTIELNMGGTDEAGINAQTENLLKSYRQAQAMGMYNTVDASWWTTPSAATMETSATANRWYSIPCFITEDGLHPSGFTTLAGVASTQTLYRNKVANYTAGAIDTTLKPAFASLYRKLNFKPAPSMEKYMTGTEFSKMMFWTDINGANKYQQLTEEANDRLVGGGKDLGVYAGDLPYNGVMVMYITGIDALAYSSTQPRYFGINSDFLFPVWHTNGYFAEEAPMNDRSQPHVFTVHIDLWGQLVCPSRQRLGIICPG